MEEISIFWYSLKEEELWDNRLIKVRAMAQAICSGRFLWAHHANRQEREMNTSVLARGNALW